MREVLGMSDEEVARGLAEQGIDPEASLQVTDAMALLPVPPRPLPDQLLFVERGESIWEQPPPPSQPGSFASKILIHLVLAVLLILALVLTKACFG
jgi:hypothetical protein